MNLLDRRDVILVFGVFPICQDRPARASNAIDGHRREGRIAVRTIEVVGYWRLQGPKYVRFAVGSKLFIARRYGQNMVYQNILVTYLVVKRLSLCEGAPEWYQGNQLPLPLEKKSQ